MKDDDEVDFKRGRFGKGTVVVAVLLALALVGIVALAVTLGDERKPSQQILHEKDPPRSPSERNSDNKEGCPCGCDHSVAMASELALEPEEVARAAVASALDTIAEREAAGYVTEAMIEHRLRLLGLARDLPHPAPRVQGTPRALELRAARSRAPAVEDGSLRVRTQLVLHGEHDEIVLGRTKLLRACFVLWMEIENLGDAELALTPPAIQARLPFPVSRWYLAGGDGASWDGKLAGRGKQSVPVIGYLGDGVAPGSIVEATVRLGPLAIPVAARARPRWNVD